MLTLPAPLTDLLLPFSPLFHSRIGAKAKLFLIGAILSPCRCTVTPALRVLGSTQETGFAK